MSVHGFTLNIASIGGDLMLIEDKMQKIFYLPEAVGADSSSVGHIVYYHKLEIFRSSYSRRICTA